MLREILSNQTIGIFIEAACLGGLGMSKMKRNREGLGDRLMVSEFFAIIRREGMPREGEGFQQGHHCGSDRVSTFAQDLGQQA